MSVGTVSNFINDTKAISGDTREQIQKAIISLGYQRNEIASSLRNARTKTLGIIVPNVANPFYTSLFEGSEAEAQAHGYTITLGVTRYQDDIFRRYLGIFSSRRMDAIIVDGHNAGAVEDLLSDVGVPVVVIEPTIPLPLCSTIQIDNLAAAKEAVGYLIAKGHERIAIIAPARSDKRFAGYAAALADARIRLDDALIYEYGEDSASVARTGDQADLIRQGEAAMNALLARTHFTACFVTLDIFAIGALKVLRDRRIAVPGDVAIVGFDDLPMSSVVNPSLTTVAQPHHEMGRLAVATAIRQIKSGGLRSPEHTVLAHHLVLRESA